ncbi:MAG: hypothetical protein LBR56_01695 [Sporomusaceae bacterium]|jgi:hypothetical protein|nr:hypothetical protein [Sporomusaceae bacterium]
MKRQTMLININNQCAVVQKNIAQNFQNPQSKELLSDLLKLTALLDKFLKTQAKT